MKPTPYMSVRTWYMATYPTDELGQEIDKNVTFYGIFDILDRHKDVYDVLPGDSVIRQRVFRGLAEVMDCDYDYIYDQWIGHPYHQPYNHVSYC